MILLRLTSAVAVVLVTGCGVSGHENQSPPDVRPLDGVTNFSDRESVALHNAQEIMISTCMRDRGLIYEVVPAIEVKRSRSANPYGLLELEKARADGYGLTAERLEKIQYPAPPDPNEDQLMAMSTDDREAWQKALLGTPDSMHEIPIADSRSVIYRADGCVHLARRATYGDEWDQFFLLFETLANTIIEETRSRPGFIDAEQKWSTCMRAASYPVTTLAAALDTLSGQLESAGADGTQLRATGEAELRMAVQDATCQDQVRLHEAVAAAQEDLQRRLLTDRESDLARFLEIREQAITRAGHILEDG